MSGDGAREYIAVAVLFADLVESTRLYERLGDLRAREVVARCLEEMGEATERWGGVVIKTMGDEVLATFASPDDAINAACEMQKRIGSHGSRANDEEPAAIRVGCHFGPVLREKRDVFGTAVHVAKRMVSLAKPNQVVTTPDLVERLESEWRAATRPIDLTTVKGRAEELVVLEVMWQPEEITAMRPALDWIERRTVPAGRLRVVAEDGEFVVDESCQRVTLGRSRDADLLVEGELISRLHARIELSKGRFILVDESTNGSLVVPTQGDGIFVRRDSAELEGEGVIWLGGVPSTSARAVVVYSLES